MFQFLRLPALQDTHKTYKYKSRLYAAVGIFCVSGPAAGILEYSVDGAPFKKLDTFTAWSGGLYIPWVYMFDTELPMGKHRLALRMSKDHHPQSKGTSCQIRQFVVNDSCE